MFASSPPGQSEVCCSHVEKSEKQRMIAFNCGKSLPKGLVLKDNVCSKKHSKKCSVLTSAHRPNCSV